MIAVPTPEIETMPKLKNLAETNKNVLEEDKEIAKPKKKKKVIHFFVVLSTLTFRHDTLISFVLYHFFLLISTLTISI